MILISTFLSFAFFLIFVGAQITAPPAPSATPTGPLPLTQYTFRYPNLPEQVNPFPEGRGPQAGYNICNSTTEGPTSECQTMFINSIDDFCLWGSPTPNGILSNVQADVVAYCTKPGHGTRLIPPGTLTAVQFIKTQGYIQLTGLFNQSGIGLRLDDGGGELDPHGPDLAGNPLGGLVFSNNLPSSKDNTTVIQVQNWSNFVGTNQFCIKACDPTVTSPDYCDNEFNTRGCNFNMPAAYVPGVFLSCLGENQAPPRSTPGIPATSSCTTYTSSLLYRNTAPTTTRSSHASHATSTSSPREAHTSIGAVAGGIVGGIAILTPLGIVILLCLRRRKKTISERTDDAGAMESISSSSSASRAPPSIPNTATANIYRKTRTRNLDASTSDTDPPSYPTTVSTSSMKNPQQTNATPSPVPIDTHPSSSTASPSSDDRPGRLSGEQLDFVTSLHKANVPHAEIVAIMDRIRRRSRDEEGHGNMAAAPPVYDFKT